MPKLILDIIRWALIICATSLSVQWLWGVHRILGLVLAVPVFVIFLNFFGFITLPLYAFSLESIMARKALRDIEKEPFKKKKKLHIKAKAGDKCGVCGRRIDKSEEVVVIDGELICRKCDEKLSNS